MNKIFKKIMNITLLFLIVATTLPAQPIAAAMIDNDINISENESVIKEDTNDIDIVENIEQLDNVIENQKSEKPIIFLGEKDLLYEKNINVISTRISSGQIQMVRADGSSTIPTFSDILVYSLPDGRYIYCLEPNKVASSGNISGNPGGNAFDRLSIGTKNKIARVTAYGDLYGRDDIMYRWAAQVLVWEAIGYRVTSYSGANMDAHINILRDKVTRHNVIPSFSYLDTNENIQEHTLRWNTSTNRYEAVLTDTNGVLSEKFAGLKSGVSGVYGFHDLGENQLLITTDIHAENRWDVTPNSKSGMTFDPNQGYSPVFITNPNAQDLAGGLADPINIKFRLRTEPAIGRAKLCKVNQNDVPLAGVEFDIFKSNGTYLGTNKTSSDGCFTTGDLVIGDYYAKEIRADSPDIIIDGNTKYTFKIKANTITTITDTNGSIKVDNFQFGKLIGKTMYAEMNDELVKMTFDVKGYIDPNLNKVKANVYQDNILMSTQDITIIPGINKFNFDVPINLTSATKNDIRVEFNNINGAMYSLENILVVPRFFPTNETIIVSSQSGEETLSTPIATDVWSESQIMKTKHYYEKFNFENIYQDLKVINGTFPINQKIKYENELNKYLDTLNETKYTMYQSLKDTTFEFEQVNNMYEFNVGYDSTNGEIYLKDFYGEIDNGRFYQAHTEKIDNPTTEQKLLYDGYVDKNDILKRVDKTYPLPVREPNLIGTGTLYPVNLKVQSVGYNNFNVEFNMTFDYITKQISTINGKSLKNPKIIPLADYSSVTNPPSQVKENYIKECDNRQEFLKSNNLINNHEEWTRTYLSTDLTKLNACEVYITYPELENRADDYFIDHGDYGGSGIYEDNYIGKPVIIQTEQDFIK